MSRLFAVIGGVLFVASLLFFAICLVSRFSDASPWSWAAAWRPALCDVLLFSAFALHHSFFARTGLKVVVTAVCPASLERSLYVWVASILFLLTCAFWQSVPGVAWHASAALGTALRTGQVVAAILTFAAAVRLDVLELAGIRQVFGGDSLQRTLDERGPYRFVRHPIYFGWVLMVWLSPTMNGTRLVFAATSCLYLALAVPFEERDLRRTFGGAYEAYMKRVRWKILPGLY